MRRLLKDPKFQLAAVLVFLSFGSYSLWDGLRYGPRASEIEILRDRSVLLTAAATSARCVAAEGGIERVTDAGRAYATMLSTLDQILPGVDGEVPILELTSSLARESMVDIETLDPAPLIEGAHYNMVPFSLDVLGPYHGVARFVQLLVGQPQIHRIRAFRMEARDTGAVRATFALERYQAPTMAPGEAVEEQEDPSPSVAYEQDGEGRIWTLVVIPGRTQPVRLPTPSHQLPQAEAWLRTRR